MATPGALRKALFDLLNQLPEVQVYQRLTEAVNMGAAGCVVVGPMAADYHMAQARGLAGWTLPLYAIVPMADYGAATDALDALVAQSGDLSIPGLLWNHRSLGLPETDCHAASLSNYGSTLADAQGMDHLAAQIDLEIYTRGDS